MHNTHIHDISHTIPGILGPPQAYLWIPGRASLTWCNPFISQMRQQIPRVGGDLLKVAHGQQGAEPGLEAAPGSPHLLHCDSFASSTGQNGVSRDGDPKLGPFGVSFSCLLVSILDIYFCSG